MLKQHGSEDVLINMKKPRISPRLSKEKSLLSLLMDFNSQAIVQYSCSSILCCSSATAKDPSCKKHQFQ